jgi:hypothetical protein
LTNNSFCSKAYSLISLIISGLCIFITISINIEIAKRFLQSDGKTRALFGITETLVFSYQYYFVGLSLTALILAIIGTKKKENKLINRTAYLIGLLSVVLIFAGIWRLMI